MTSRYPLTIAATSTKCSGGTDKAPLGPGPGGLVTDVIPGIVEQAQVQIKSLEEALAMFKLDNGVYPTTEEGLQALITNPSEEEYPAYAPNAYFEGKNLPKDSWKNEFIYINNGTDFDLISLGADRKEGGEGDAADIRFSECKF